MIQIQIGIERDQNFSKEKIEVLFEEKFSVDSNFFKRETKYEFSNNYFAFPIFIKHKFRYC